MPKIPFPETMEGWNATVKSFTTGQLDVGKKTTLFKAMIEKRYDTNLQNNTKGLLDFCALQGLRYTGMHLLTLMDPVSHLHNVPEQDLAEWLWFSSTEKSWLSYQEILVKYMGKDLVNKPKYWMYGREFDSSTFTSMTFNKNHYLCEILAALIDEQKTPVSHLRTNAAAGPSYLGIVVPRTQVPKLNDNDFAIVKAASDYLNNNFLNKPSSGKAGSLVIQARALMGGE